MNRLLSILVSVLLLHTAAMAEIPRSDQSNRPVAEEEAGGAETSLQQAENVGVNRETETGDSDSSESDSENASHGDHGGHVEWKGPSDTMRYMATLLFGLAIFHTFIAGYFQKLAHEFDEGSILENLFHILGEVEAVFVVWSAALFVGLASLGSYEQAVAYIESRNYTEPSFVFVIMVISATAPVINLVNSIIHGCTWCLQKTLRFLSEDSAFLFCTLVVGTMLGSFVTEPAAMTVSALILKRRYFDRALSDKFMYAILGTLFVNVSIGGTATNFAAPPVLMAAVAFHLTPEVMLGCFGWKALVATIINAARIQWRFGKELAAKPDNETPETKTEMHIPAWVQAVHVLALAFVVINAHHPLIFGGGFMLFLGFCQVTKEYQEELKIGPALMVAGFLGGLVTLGGLQDWWIRPLLLSLGAFSLFSGTTALTAITDNAALTYLAAQVKNLSVAQKYAVVAGAVTGGGLTVIANAPNPAGYSILNPMFKQHAGGPINPVRLLWAAIPPTVVAFVCFWFLPNLVAYNG